MKILKKLMIATGLVFATSAAVANSGMYEVEVTGLQGLNILGGATVWQPAPLYPSLALRRGVEGKVLVEYNINAEGKAENIQVIQSSPRGFFDSATVRALRNTTFGVAYEDGKAVASNSVKKRFVYRIERDTAGNAQPMVSIN